ncbi:MAG: hypothetical protein RLZ45_1414 [Verrucomicrobiota bacterium]|jgi:HD-like signal output (HDOD) protein
MSQTKTRRKPQSGGALSRLLENPSLRRWLLPPSMRKVSKRSTIESGKTPHADSMAVWKATHGHGGTRPPLPGKRPASTVAKTPPKKKGGGRKRALMSVRLPERPRALVSERRQSVPQSPTSGPAGTETPRPPIPSVLTASSPSIEVSSPPPSTPTTAPKPSAIINPFAGWSKKEVQDRIRELVGDIEIPRFRKAVFETLRRLRDPDTTPQKLMEVMAIDGELVGKVMNTVNSTAYSPRSRIQSLDHAILLMGNADLERIVMMVGAKAALPQQTHPQFALSTFWKASSRRAVLAREIADLVQPAKANLSFTAGFLQDLSVPLIVTSKKDQYVSLFNTALEEKRDLHLLEAETLGWDHAELGALVALNWELPDDVTLCLKDHNQPESASRPDPAYFVSSLLPSHGEEWHSHFATRVNDRYVVAPEILDSICKDSIQKANDLAKLF